MAMGQMISPGVYTRIIDLSEYLTDIPGTVAFLPILSRRGKDNSLEFLTAQDQFLNRFGEPNIEDYGKSFGQGPYVAMQHLAVSSHLYVMRALPDDATYAHLIIGMQKTDDTAEHGYSSSFNICTLPKHLELVGIHCDGQTRKYRRFVDNHYIESEFVTPTINHAIELESLLNIEVTDWDKGIYGPDAYMWTNDTSAEIQDPDGKIIDPTSDELYSDGTGGIGIDSGFLMYFRSVGRGASYNDFSIRLSRQSNPELFGIYILDIFEVQDDGDLVIVQSLNVSFDPNMLDDEGDSLFIEDVVNKFSDNIICRVNRSALNRLEKEKEPYYRNDPTLPEDISELYLSADESGELNDPGYKGTRIEYATLDYDEATEELTEALATLADVRTWDTDDSDAIVKRNTALSNAISDVAEARIAVASAKLNLEEAYGLDIMDMGEIDSETSQMEPWTLDGGSEGSLVYEDKNTGKTLVSSEIATKLLSDAYLGLLQKPDNLYRSDGSWKEQYTDEVYDLDWIYFSLVYDAGYPADVKDAAYKLCDTIRRDCMLISDCGDNIDYDDLEEYVGGNPALPGGRLWSSRYVARYEPYSRVYDTYTGRDMWLSPVYHMAQTIPLNDRLYELWYPSAGFNRGTLAMIKELRWSPKLGERDKLYMLQVNPIVHFPGGYTIWGNLTTQKRATALQDINCMRLVLYIKRALEQFCKYYIFELNDSITHQQIASGIRPFLDKIKANRGLVSYSVEVGATDYEFKNKICHVNVTLTPMKVIEKIELNLYVK